MTATCVQASMRTHSVSFLELSASAGSSCRLQGLQCTLTIYAESGVALAYTHSSSESHQPPLLCWIELIWIARTIAITKLCGSREWLLSPAVFLHTFKSLHINLKLQLGITGNLIPSIQDRMHGGDPTVIRYGSLSFFSAFP
jgi:hypothetical protein